jgi:UDP-glucose 4-epimerase
MDKVVVIGGSGFVGSHTADALSERGYQVTIYDCKTSPWLREDQKMVLGDVLDIDKLYKTIDGARYVYHYAGIADISESMLKPYETININVMGASAVVQAAVKAGVERFIYASTMYVYSPYGSFYRASKQATETIIEAYHEQYGIDYTFLRYGSLYGPRAQEWNGLYGYVNQIISDRKLNYRGSGNEKREYIHVRDAAALSVKILDDKHKNQAITVTGQQILNSNELIDMIFEITGIRKNVEYHDEDTDSGHYKLTPYRYTPKQAKKLVPEEFIDIGQGILEVVEDISHKS